MKAGQLRFDNMTLLVLKLGAFAVMIGDHIDMFFADGHGVHAGIGRLVFPVFGCILAYNMARTDPDKLLRVVVPRMLGLGLLSQIAYMVLQGAPLPLNILLTLAAAAVVYALWSKGAVVAGIVVLMFAGAYVDYSWWGVAGVVLLAFAFREPKPVRVSASLVLFCLALTLTNGNLVAIYAVPVLYVAMMVRWGNAPRWKWLFLAGYPAHLVILAALRYMI